MRATLRAIAVAPWFGLLFIGRLMASLADGPQPPLVWSEVLREPFP